MPKAMVKMRFCEIFNISPIEYDNLPQKLVVEWLHIKSLENQWKDKKN